MSPTLENMLNSYYETFRGRGTPEIVRNNTKDDAFELVVLKIIYGRFLDLSFDIDHIEEIQKYVIAPPDAGIDIFVEIGNGDDSHFDVIQVKNTDQTEQQLRDIFSVMKRTISDFCKSPTNVASLSCRTILSDSSLDSTNFKKNCNYYVVHTGNTREFSGIKKDEHIITTIDLDVLCRCVEDKVGEDRLSITGKDQSIAFGNANDSQSAIICNINGYDLAVLNNKYYSTEIGRNILFGHNLRESLSPKSSKSYAGMKDTVCSSPEKFWYYNNGITLVTEELEIENNAEEDSASVVLRRFSIVNGAQTTSSLGLILREAEINRDNQVIEQLKQTFVLARILKVNDTETQRNIAIYNNTQNPITSRDMASRNNEQIALYNHFMDDTYPQIYMETKRGTSIPNRFNRSITHRKTTNETLAQLAYAGFLLQPFTAKDKKAELFTNDLSQSEFTMNKIYHKIFNYVEEDDASNGILFQKSKLEVDELLFSQYLYKEGKKLKRREIQARLDNERNQQQTETDADLLNQIQSRINRDSDLLETIGVCMFYYIATYYEFNGQFGHEWQGLRYDYERIYSDRDYQNQIVSDFAQFLLMLTVKTLIKTAKENGYSSNINNWVRNSGCQTKYLDSLRNDIGYDEQLSLNYRALMQQYKIVPTA